MHEERREGHKVEDDTNIEATSYLVDNPRNFVEARTLREIYVASFLEPNDTIFIHGISLRKWHLSEENLKLIVHHGLVVVVRQVHDDLKSYEVNDTVIDSVLVCQQHYIKGLAKQGHQHLDQPKNERYL